MQIIKTIFNVIKSLILLFILICFVAFMVNNRDAITLSLAPLPFKIETRVFMILIIFFVSGALFSFAILSHDLLLKSLTNMRNNFKIKKLEKEVLRKNN
jgi:hypothetical protein